MCGIAGILDAGGAAVLHSHLSPMAAAMRHRGPDDEGVWSERSIGLAHRRLSVIDLSSRGHQPMSNDDGTLWISYNGEVYNFPSLSVELKTKGFSFKSRTDTEVVLKAYEAWGTEAFAKFNGMFALAIWDGRRRTLVLARDRYGVKPLYWTRAGNRFLFASEIKALLAVPGVSRKANLQALSEYFCFQNLYGEETLFEGIRLLSPGTVMEVSADGTVRTSAWWDLRFGPDPEDANRSEESWRDELKSRFERAVTRQLVSDVPLGCYLSGGMDSGSIAAVASRSIPRLMTFTGGFDLSSVSGMELSFDERREAEILSAAFLTEQDGFSMGTLKD
ncbi:MAG: asparagine synthase (glutamine-hydrolyzing), partial [Planctomycetota bacterium]